MANKLELNRAEDLEERAQAVLHSQLTIDPPVRVARWKSPSQTSASPSPRQKRSTSEVWRTVDAERERIREEDSVRDLRDAKRPPCEETVAGLGARG